MSTQTAKAAGPYSDAADLCRAALAAAERGWRVFPIRPGVKKPPAVKDWETRATTDPDRIRRCWAHAAYNIGIATGPSGLVVIDLDVPHDSDITPPAGWNEPGVTNGLDAFALLAERHGQRLPLDTFMVTTPTGGTHLYYTARPNSGLRNTNGHPVAGRLPDTALGWLIDTRAGGGYVLAPGSVTSNGAYVIASSATAAALPAWLADLLTVARPNTPLLSALPAPGGPVRDLNAYTRQALKGEVERVRAAQTGGRNAALNKAAYNLGRLVAGGTVPEDVAYNSLRDAAAAHIGVADFTEREADATIRAAFRAAAQHPRSAA